MWNNPRIDDLGTFENIHFITTLYFILVSYKPESAYYTCSFRKKNTRFEPIYHHFHVIFRGRPKLFFHLLFNIVFINLRILGF